MDAKTVLPGVKNIIAVVSGQRRCWERTVAANLALALAQHDAQDRFDGCRYLWPKCSDHVWCAW
jgi:hypothetical protein